MMIPCVTHTRIQRLSIDLLPDAVAAGLPECDHLEATEIILTSTVGLTVAHHEVTTV